MINAKTVQFPTELNQKHPCLPTTYVIFEDSWTTAAFHTYINTITEHNGERTLTSKPGHASGEQRHAP